MPTREDHRDYAAERSKKTALTERQEEALGHRRRGRSYPEIGKIMGIGEARSRQLVNTALQKLTEWNKGEAEYVRDMELARIDAWSAELEDILTHWRVNDANTDENHDGKVISDELAIKTIGQLAKLQERRSKILGIEKLEPPDGGNAPWQNLLVRVTRDVNEASQLQSIVEDDVE